MPVAGEFDVSSATTVITEDGLPTTHIIVDPVTMVRGAASSLTVILPGGSVNGEFVKLVDESFEVTAGERLFLMLEPATGLPDFYNVAYGFHVGVFRRAARGADRVVTDPWGRAVVDVPCDARPVRAVQPRPDQVQADTDESGVPAAERTHASWVESDQPEALAMTWTTAMAALVACGVTP